MYHDFHENIMQYVFNIDTKKCFLSTNQHFRMGCEDYWLLKTLTSYIKIENIYLKNCFSCIFEQIKAELVCLRDSFYRPQNFEQYCKAGLYIFSLHIYPPKWKTQPPSVKTTRLFTYLTLLPPIDVCSSIATQWSSEDQTQYFI